MNYFIILMSIFCFVETYAAPKYQFKSTIKAKIGKRPRVRRVLADLNLTKTKCESLAKTQLKTLKRKIIPFAVGSRISKSDIYGAFTSSFTKGGFGKYAKKGLPDNHEFDVEKLQTQYAIHSDARCYRFVKVTKVDLATYKGKQCRRINYKLGTHKYKTLFCLGETIAYVDHFNLSK